jgi:hypothetical protein
MEDIDDFAIEMKFLEDWVVNPKVEKLCTDIEEEELRDDEAILSHVNEVLFHFE